jgi:hypothetical protein
MNSKKKKKSVLLIILQNAQVAVCCFNLMTVNLIKTNPAKTKKQERIRKKKIEKKTTKQQLDLHFHIPLLHLFRMLIVQLELARSDFCNLSC